MEKSPSNVVISTMLHAAWAKFGVSSRYIYLTRHPIAQVMAMREFVDDLDYAELIEHWCNEHLATHQHSSCYPTTFVLIVLTSKMAPDSPHVSAGSQSKKQSAGRRGYYRWGRPHSSP